MKMRKLFILPVLGLTLSHPGIAAEIAVKDERYTPTWTSYDAAVYGTDLPEEAPATHQERAYTSPIWYTPGTPGAD